MNFITGFKKWKVHHVLLFSFKFVIPLFVDEPLTNRLGSVQRNIKPKL